ncbi:hypothetical protein CKO40_20590 [Halochromatium glycolicum]|uniref:Uncharacterized protein n=1 Tax=Halochromatium glycolicum TaxID=85075 RepID=A0AAJ0U7Q8_9GAMM|nr:hypothetical protein [Halochromatium glycolicum]
MALEQMTASPEAAAALEAIGITVHRRLVNRVFAEVVDPETPSDRPRPGRCVGGPSMKLFVAPDGEDIDIRAGCAHGYLRLGGYV